MDIIESSYKFSLYGLSSNDSASFLWIFLIALFLLKMVTALSLWTEKDWAIQIGIIDAIIGIAICTFFTLIEIFEIGTANFNFNFRLELIVLIPYLIKLNKIKKPWKESNNTEQVI